MCTAQRIVAPVISQVQVSPSYYRLKFASELIANTAKAGQFVHILPRGGHISDPLLRRAFSILSVQDDVFEILYKAIGKGTEQMSLWQAGRNVDILGPLGQPFNLSDKFFLDSGITLLVGGGVGAPPLAMLATQNPSVKNRVLLGGRSGNDILCRDDFARSGAQVEVATEDGSAGHKGLVTDLLKIHLEDAFINGIKACVFSCGPLPMLRAVATLCLEANVPCQISLEENMPCGIGICNGCVVPVVGAGDDYGRYRRICVEGPVMAAQDIDWSNGELTACP